MKALSELGISPAPWSMKTWQASDDYGTIVESANHNTVCDCSWSALGDEQGEVDASLIAAAPELYEALRGLLEWRGLRGGDIEEKVETAKEFCSRIAKARAAIAKASGQEVAK